MPNVIDALVVTLGLDPSKFTEGQNTALEAFRKTREESEHTAKTMEGHGKKAAAFFDEIKKHAIELAVALIGGYGIKDFIGRIVESGVALGQMSRTAGVSAAALEVWGTMAEKAGLSAAGAQKGIENIAMAISKLSMAEGNPELLIALAQIPHMDSKKFIDSDQEQRLYMLADALHNMPDQAKALQLGINVTGSDSLTRLLMAFDSDALKKAAKELGELAPTKEDIDAANRFNQAWTGLTRTLKEVGRSAWTGVSGGISDLLDELNKFIASNKDEIVKWVSEFWGVVKGLAIAINDVVQAMGGWVPVLEALFAVWAGAKLVGVASGIVSIVAALVTIGPAAALALSAVSPLLLALVAVGAAMAAITAVGKNAPNIDAWLDRHVPGASALDNWLSQFGLGANTEEQAARDEAAGRAPLTHNSRAQHTPRSPSALWDKTKNFFSNPLEALGLIEHYESDGRNVHQNIVSPKISSASGYWQITDTTWKRYAPMVGVDPGQYPTAMSAPRDVQQKVATKLYESEGFGPWAPYNPRLAGAIASHPIDRSLMAGATAGARTGNTSQSSTTTQDNSVEIHIGEVKSDTPEEFANHDRIAGAFYNHMKTANNALTPVTQ